MNSRLSPARPFTTTTSRAQLSPVSRTLTLRTVGRAASSTSPALSPRSRSPFTTADTSPEASIGRIWTPGLLDTLQASLSRYRE